MSGNRGVGNLPGQIGNTAGGGPRPPADPERKAYTRAVRELMDALYDEGHPKSWGARKTWTNAQELAERHLALALSGSEKHAEIILNRAEGRAPTAPEDRASNEVAAGKIGAANFSALQALQQALGLRHVEVVTVEPEEQPKLGTGEETPGEQG